MFNIGIEAPTPRIERFVNKDDKNPDSIQTPFSEKLPFDNKQLCIVPSYSTEFEISSVLVYFCHCHELVLN